MNWTDLPIGIQRALELDQRPESACLGMSGPDAEGKYTLYYLPRIARFVGIVVEVWESGGTPVIRPIETEVDLGHLMQTDYDSSVDADQSTRAAQLKSLLQITTKTSVLLARSFLEIVLRAFGL